MLEIDEMCSDHFNLLLTVIPRYDAESTCLSLDPQRKYDLYLFEMQMMLHLEGLNCTCLSFCQISSLMRSSWRLSQSESSTTTPYKRVSSANSLTVEVRPFGRSLMYVRNNSRPSTDPCGTPEVTGEEVDVAPSQMTVWTLFVRKWVYKDLCINILLIITTTSANAQFSSSFYEGLACIAPTSCLCSFVAFTQ